MKEAGLVFGVDTGGTFTDIVGVGGDGRILIRKVDGWRRQSNGHIAKGVESLRGEASICTRVDLQVVHLHHHSRRSGIEHKGPVCRLITTAGFRDVLELGRQHNPVLYDIFGRRTSPLVPRRRVVEVQERIAADGNAVIPLDEVSLEAALDVYERRCRCAPSRSACNLMLH